MISTPILIPANAIEGDDSRNYYIGTGGNDFYLTYGNNDTVYASAGSDTIYGGDGNDFLLGYGYDGVADGNDLIFGEGGRDILRGNDGNDTLDGGEGNDNLAGGEGDDLLIGGAGDDILTATGNSHDTLIGGAGADTFRIALPSSEEFFELNVEIRDFVSGEDKIEITHSDESLQIGFLPYSTEATDMHVLTNNFAYAYVQFPQLLEISIDDFIGFEAEIDGDDTGEYIEVTKIVSWTHGRGGNDTIIGSHSFDVIEGGDGDDSIDAGGAQNVVFGGNGNDFIAVSSSADNSYLAGQNGNDTLVGGAQGDTLTGGDGDDSIVGGEGNDNIDGGDGNDTLDGGEGLNILTGGQGSDLFIFSDDNSYEWITDFETGTDKIDFNVEGIEASDIRILFEGSGLTDVWGLTDGASSIAKITFQTAISIDDIVGVEATHSGDASNNQWIGTSDREWFAGRDGNDIVYAAGGDDTIEGGNGRDFLNGNDGNDLIFGGDDSDVIRGNDGDDSIFGGAGRDQLNGGEGIDVFFYTALTDSTDSGRDYILGFDAGENIPDETFGTVFRYGDRIDVRELGFTGIVAGEGSGTVLGYEQVGSKTIISDVNSDFSIELTGYVGELSYIHFDFSS